MNLTIVPTQNNGLGFLPAVAAAPAAGPAAPIVVAVAALASGIAKIFGFGGDDQKTNYRPPTNAADYGFQIGDQLVGFDMSNLAEAVRRGNRVDDLYSYYSAFASNSTGAGASKAAKKVIEDAARKYGWSIRQAAAVILETAGVRKITEPVQAQQPAPSQQQNFLSNKPVEPPSAPVYDVAAIIAQALKNIVKPPPIPTYQPIPNEPAPAPPPGQPQTGKTPLQVARDAAIAKAIQLGQKELALLLQRQQRVANEAAAAGCNPDATYYDRSRNQCVTLVPCPQGQYFEPAEGGCVVPEEGLGDLLSSLGTIGGIPVWLLLALGLLVISRRGDDGRTVSFRRRS